jgi:hypothetical protein
MSLLMPERLYRLLPAFLRDRDLDQGEPLRALLAVVEGELERVEGDIATLYDNWFIETCDDWVVPYIGDLLGVRPIRPVESAGVSLRAYVANTIAYRRRKGTAVILEQLARDTTGWPARAVEFFMRLATTQHVNHVRLAPPATPSMRDAARAELADGPFDPCAHTVEVRNAATRGGRFNVPNIGIYLWRLRSYEIGAGSPGDESADFTSARRQAGWWAIHPVGCDSPLFNVERTETTITHLAEEQNVPGELRRLALHAELDRLRAVATPPTVFMTQDRPVVRVFVRLAGEPLPVEVRREDIYVCDMPDDIELAVPAPRALALDPSRGRVAFPSALDVAEVWVRSSYGFSGDLGGGPYDRTPVVRDMNDPDVWQVGVSHLLPDDGTGKLFGSLREAVEAWNAQPPGRSGVIVLMDSLSDDDSAGGATSPLEIVIGERSRLLVVAGEWPLQPIPGAPPGSMQRVPGSFDARHIRAHFIGDIAVRGSTPADSADAGTCRFNGLLLEGRLVVAPGNLAQLDLAHCTVVPGRGSIEVAAARANERLSISLNRCICASISVADPIRAIRIEDSIVGNDGGSPSFSLRAPETAVELLRSSFFSDVLVLTLSASDCIFAGSVEALRRQVGCVRFSYVAPGSRVPRRYRCQPELEIATRIEKLRRASPPGAVTPAQQVAIRVEVAAQIRPLFVSRRYGAPGLGQLELRCAAQIRGGAESGAEMGAFEFLKQPQREANLRDALAEYLRFGLEARLVFVN